MTRRGFLGLAALLLCQLQRAVADESPVPGEAPNGNHPKPVIHDNDGHVDDIISTLLIWLTPAFSLKAITVNDGDCFPRQSFEAMLKIADFLDIKDTEIALSEAPCPNQFPERWRKHSFRINELPLINSNKEKVIERAGKARRNQELLIEILTSSIQKVNLLCTGPLSCLAAVFEQRPDLKVNVEHCYVMGGAISVPGNVNVPGHDGSAEWNFFADPLAARKFMELGLPTTLVPLDVTDEVPVTSQFLERLGRQAEKSRASQLASHLFGLLKGTYYFWDVLTAACLVRPELFTYKEQRLEVIATGKSQGRMRSTASGGGIVRVADSVNARQFEEMVLEVLRRR
jgi:purine nucleosidase